MRRHAVYRVATLALALFAVTCGSTPPTGPGPILAPSITSVTPAAGPLSGGTDITIRGARFATGATVSVGGRSATDVRIQSSDVIVAKTPPASAPSAVDVVVTIDGRTGTLAAAFRYESATANTAPVIRSLTARGSRLNEPANFADYGETIQLTAVVEDAETPPIQLVYQWESGCGGVFLGSGAQISWRAPSNILPVPNCRIELTVVDGGVGTSQAVTVRVHDSAAEVGALALEFLTEFADSTIPAATTVRNFSDSCPGKFEELKQVTANRENYTILSHTYGEAKTTIAFGGKCKTKTADACVITPVEWRSLKKQTNQIEIATGISTISGVYREARWWLCDSLADGPSGSGLWPATLTDVR
jgi:hypothetical protein